MCPGVATTRSSTPAAVTTSPSANASEPSTSDGSSARTGAPVSSWKRRAPPAWSWWRWVSSTSATGPCAATARRCPSSSSPGSITTQSGASGARSTQVLVPSSVIGDGFSASTTPRVRGDLAELLVGVRSRSTSPGRAGCRRRSSGSTATRSSGWIGSIVRSLGARPAQRRSRGARRSRAAWLGGQPSASYRPRPSVRGLRPGATSGPRRLRWCARRRPARRGAGPRGTPCRSAAATTAGVIQRDQARRRSAAQRALAEQSGRVGGARRARRARSRGRFDGPVAAASSTPHSSNVSRTAALTRAAASSGGWPKRSPTRPGRGRSSGARRRGRRGRRCRRGTRSSRPRRPCPRPGVGGTPAARCGRGWGGVRRGSAATVAAGFGTTHWFGRPAGHFPER